MAHPAFAEHLARAKAGDDVAFAVLWRDLNPAVVRYAKGLAGPSGEDAASETWIEVVKRIGSFVGDEASFRSWVFTIARSKLVDAWRKDSRRPSEPTADLETIRDQPSAPSAADAALESLATEDALRLIASLPREQAEVVLLRVIAGLDVAAVAKIVGCSAGNVRIRQHRGLRKLAELVNRQRVAVTQ